MSKEDTFPVSNKYSWHKDYGLPLADFLSKTLDGPERWDQAQIKWIWVKGSEDSSSSTLEQEAQAIVEASTLLNEVTEKVESIKNDDSIPVRSNKKTGVKSKKEVREQVQAEATEKLREISVKHDYVNGKWLVFAPAERVDAIWSTIATSLVSGPLHSTAAYLAKVSTSPESESPNRQHIICIYFPNVYDKAEATKIMKVLLRNHGLNLSGVKSDMYTVIGIDSKHASGIPSTVWKNSAILPDNEIKELKDAFFAELASGANKPAPTETAAADAGALTSAEAAPQVEKVKPKLKLKKKVEEDDPFASDDDKDDKAKPPAKPASKANRASVAKGKPQKDEPEDLSEDVHEEEKPKKTSGAKRFKRARKVDSDSEEYGEERPNKRAVR